MSSVPIDNINPDITIASDLQLIKEFYINNEFEFGVPEDSKRAPLTIGANPWSVANVNHRDWLDLLPVDEDKLTEDPTPTFEWEFEEGFEDVEEVNLFVSSFPKDKGLLPWDELADLSDPTFLPELNKSQKKALLTRLWQEYDDFNPGRILTATWKKDTNTWYWHDGKTEIAQESGALANNKNRFTLPDSLALTTGQDYYWSVEAVDKQGKSNIDFSGFEAIAPPSTNPFSSVSILTHGFTLLQENSTGIPNSFYDFADTITEANGKEEKGLILRYDKASGTWIPVDENRRTLTDITGGLATDPNYLSTLASNIQTTYQNKPLVLLPEWSLDDESTISTSGFTEGAADAFFASMVQLDQALGGKIGITNDAGDLTQLYDDRGDLIRTQGDLFNSPLHFIGYSRGAVVNSEIIQRLETYYPYAGGAINADGTPVKDENNKPVRDLQMTTVDPHDFEQENLRVPIPIIGADFRDFNEPAVEVWDNVTFADNYYQTVANPNRIGGTPNGRAIEGADLNVQLDGRTGFTWDNRIGGPHTKVLGWYAGTADFDREEVRAGYEADKKGLISEPIYDRLGEDSLSQLLDPKDPERYSKLTSWYDSDSELNSEGIGEGWAYSVLSGGKRPDVNLSTRTSVGFDNTDPDGTGGDFAIPTVFNGNFDYAVNNQPGKEIPDDTKVPGWSFHNGQGTQPLLYKDLVDVDSISTIVELETSLDDDLSASLTVEEQKNLASKLGDGNPKKYTHNLVNVPEWGDLRFDLHVPNLNNGQVKVSLSSAVPGFENYDFEPINLTEAIGSQPEYEDDRYRIGYGKDGFETFHLDIPDELRGKVVSLEFELVGSEKVYLDNVFFQSKHLLFGNPTEARQPEGANPYENNYLLEKPQFSVSYSENDNIPNWSAWQLNRNWTGNADRPSDKFFGDPDITSLGWVGVKDSDYDRPKSNLPQINPDDGEPYKLASGHLSPVSHRDRSGKDIWSTYLTTNVVPQFDKLNSPVWRDLENQFEKKLITRTTDQREIYIYSGSVGTKQDKTSINITSGSNAPYDIRVPEDLWRVVVVLEEPGLGIADINSSNTQAFALIAANELPTSTSPKLKFDPWYTNGNIVLTDIASLEDYLNLDPTNVTRGIEYNFLSNLPDNVGTAIKNQTFPTLPPNSKPSDAVDAFLLADSVNSNSFIADTTIDPNSVPIDVFFEENTFDISPNESSIGQIAFDNLGTKQTSISQIGTGQISHDQRSFTQSRSTQVSPFEVGTIQTGGVEVSSTQISPTQVDPLNIGVGEIQPAEVDSTQIISDGVAEVQPITSEISDSSIVQSENFLVLQQWFIDHAFSPKSSIEVSDTLNSLWNYNLSTPFDFNVKITDLPKGQLAEATITGFDDAGKPNAGTIQIDHNANGVGWFIDETPLDNSEFTAQNTDSYLLAAADSKANGKYDLLTTVLHELSHLYGFIDGYEGFDELKAESRRQRAEGTTGDDEDILAGENFSATLDGEHLDKSAHPYDLLNTHLALGMRKLPSELDVEILQALIATEFKKNGNKPEGEELLAKLTSDPLLAISNGDFSIFDTTTDSFAWDTRGASGIEDGQAILTEDSPFLSNFTQTFTVPAEAKTVQFKLIDAELGASELAPPDAFEVALLDANTQESLVTDNDLTETDSLLNIQNDGTAYFSDKVRIGGAASGEIIELDKSRTVTVDISDLTPGTKATLFFDLLGFSEIDSRVVIDDVRLSDQNLLPPTAVDDTATTTQGQPAIIDILANDTDDDGTIAPESVQIQTEPTNGAVRVNDDGTVTYTPSDRAIGTDSFTYVVQDNDGQLSEPASVSVEVENVAPEITEIQIPDDITEGDEITLNANATDAGNDELTYTA